MIGRLSAVGVSATLWLTVMLSLSPVAQDRVASSRIKRVTLYRGGAIITRTASLQLPAGRSTVTVRGLPAAFQEDTLRVMPEGDGLNLVAYTLGSVGSTGPEPGTSRGDSKLDELLARRRELDDREAAIQLKKKTIEALAARWPQDPDPADRQGAAAGAADWKQTWTTLEQGLLDALSGLRSIEASRRELDRQVAQHGAASGATVGDSSTTRDLDVVLLAPRDCSAGLRITYEVRDARWTVSYDGRMKTDIGRLELQQYAEISQQSAEDWEDVELFLSSARPSAGQAATVPPPWYLQALREQPQGRSAVSAVTVTGASPIIDSRKTESGAVISDAMFAEMGEYQVEYGLKGRCTIPNTGKAQRLPLWSGSIPCSLVAEVAPRMSTKAFLSGECAFEGELMLLPGALSLYLDGAPVGLTRLPLVRGGDSFALSFGEDERIAVTYRAQPPVRTERGFVKKETRTEKSSTATVKNLHGTAVKIRLIDSIPVSRDPEIAVTLLPTTTPPTEVDYRQRQGVFMWTQDFAPKEQRDFTLVYEVVYPADLKVQGL